MQSSIQSCWSISWNHQKESPSEAGGFLEVARACFSKAVSAKCFSFLPNFLAFLPAVLGHKTAATLVILLPCFEKYPLEEYPLDWMIFKGPFQLTILWSYDFVEHDKSPLDAFCFCSWADPKFCSPCSSPSLPPPQPFHQPGSLDCIFISCMILFKFSMLFDIFLQKGSTGCILSPKMSVEIAVHVSD